jgi:hypothetical protein
MLHDVRVWGLTNTVQGRQKEAWALTCQRCGQPPFNQAQFHRVPQGQRVHFPTQGRRDPGEVLSPLLPAGGLCPRPAPRCPARPGSLVPSDVSPPRPHRLLRLPAPPPRPRPSRQTHPEPEAQHVVDLGSPVGSCAQPTAAG